MMARRVALAVLAVLAVTTAAVAQTTGSGFLNGSGLGAGVNTSTPGGSGGGSSGTSSGGGGGSVPTCTAPGGSGPAGYSAVSADTAARLNSGGPRPEELFPGNAILAGRTQPNPTVNNPNPEPEQGTWYAKTCGGNMMGYLWAPAGTSPGPPPPPPPPTAAEVRNLTPLPDPAFGVSPLGTGLTGMPTWLWDSNGGDPRTATSTIRGYSVVSNAQPNTWRWNMAASGPSSASNPPPVVTATRPGSKANPAATYRYETAGEYGLTLEVTWGGSFTYSGNGVGPVTSDLGTTTRLSSRSFGVDEIRPVLKSA